MKNENKDLKVMHNKINKVRPETHYNGMTEAKETAQIKLMFSHQKEQMSSENIEHPKNKEL